MNLQQFIKMVCDNHKSGKWLSGYFDVETAGKTYSIGIKTYGKWVQRLECNGIISTVEECKTLKVFSAALEGELLLILLNA